MADTLAVFAVCVGVAACVGEMDSRALTPEWRARDWRIFDALKCNNTIDDARQSVKTLDKGRHSFGVDRLSEELTV
jgi:hypothetical protein